MSRISMFFLFGFFIFTGSFCILENINLHNQAYAYKKEISRLTETSSRLAQSFFKSKSDIINSFKGKERYWDKILSKLDSVTQSFLVQKKDLKVFLKHSTEDVEDLINSKIKAQNKNLGKIQTTTFQNKTNLAELKQKIKRNCQRMKESMIYPTVQLRGKGTVGSGVIVFSGQIGKKGSRKIFATYVLSAYHVIFEVSQAKNKDTVEDIRIMGKNDNLMPTKYKGKVVAFNTQIDIALIKLMINKPLPYVATFISPGELQKIQIFDSAYTVGCPLGNIPLPSLGEITTKHKMVDKTNFWMFNAPTFFGNSGGGVFLAQNGKLLGLTSMVYTYGKNNPVVVPHLGLFMPADTICAWLEKKNYNFIYNHNRVVPDTSITSLNKPGCKNIIYNDTDSKHGITVIAHERE